MKKYIFLTLVVVNFASCKKDTQEVTQPAPELQEAELITSLLVNLHRIDIPGDTVTFAFRDTDGPGGNPPLTTDTIQLAADGEYGCYLAVLDESASPVLDITEEIVQEADEHLFCYDPMGAALSVVRTDSDGVYEIGLTSQWTTQAAGSGGITITLKHQPGVKNGTCTPGDTDIEVSFPYIVE